MADPSTGISSDVLSSLMTLGGGALAGINQQQNYGVLQNALKTIGPTQLQGFGLSGPGGMSTGFNPQKGTGNINLGALNPAFGGFAGAAGAGAGGYNAGLPYALAGGASSTLNPALSTLFGAYGNYNAGMGAANTQLSNLGNFNTSYNNLLGAMRAQMQPQVQQQAYGLQNTLFGNGVADSTGAASGSLAAQNFGRGVGQADASAQLAAFQQALGQQQTAGSLYGQLSNSASGILNNAFQNFGGTNQLISGLNTAGLNNAATAAQGAGALNTVGLNNYNAGLQTSLAQSTARNQSLFPYASTAAALAGTPNAMGLFGSLLSQGGANGGGLNLNSLFNSGRNLYNGYNSLFGGGVSGVSGADMAPIYNELGGTPSSLFGDASLAGQSVNATDASWLLGPSSAGGEAAAGLGAGADAAASAGLANDAGLAASTNAYFGGGALGGGAGDSALAGAGLSLSGAAAGAGAGAMLAIAAHQPGVSFNKNWWDTLNNTLAAGPGAGAAASDPAGIKQYTQYEGALNALDSDYGNGQNGVNAMPSGELQYLASLGIKPQSLAYLPAAGAAGQAMALSLGIPTTSQTSTRNM